MAEVYQRFRTYELIIGDPSTSKGLRIIGNEKTNEGLQISFRIKKFLNNKESSNTASIEITNLSEDSINYIQKEQISVVLKVGYEDVGNKVIFIGNVLELSTNDRSGSTDRVTTLRCTPSSKVIYSPTISKTFPKNSTPRDIINYLIGQSDNIAKASFNSDSINQAFPFGYPVEGTIKQILDQLSVDFDFTYRIDNKRLYISDNGNYQSKNSTERAFVISPYTGLLGTPTYASSDGKRIKDAAQKYSGVKFKALLNPLLQPSQAVKIEDTTINGIFRINGVEFTGDWRGNEWSATCWCAKI